MSGDSRDETPDEKHDRNWNDLLQEMRVMQTGVQLIAGLLLTLPFQERFEELDEVQRDLYLALVLLAGLTTALMLVPISVHRRIWGQHVKERLVASTHQLIHVVLGAIALLIVGMTVLVFDMVVDRTWALVAGGAMVVVVVTLLAVVPMRVARGL